MPWQDMYTFVSGSIPEIRANAEAALILQCDPDGRLEEDTPMQLGRVLQRSDPGSSPLAEADPCSFVAI